MPEHDEVGNTCVNNNNVRPLDAVAAFCGLANPDTFFETLRDAGATMVTTTTFRDHHRYHASDVKRETGIVALRAAEELSVSVT